MALARFLAALYVCLSYLLLGLFQLRAHFMMILLNFCQMLNFCQRKRLSVFFDKHNVLTPSQHGFRKHRSAESALLAQKEFILKTFEARKMVLGIFVDFTKAFDLLNHDILLHKLESLGVRGHALALFQSYLNNRCQYVTAGGSHSDVRPILSRVPQGSILGPLLFNVFINDIVKISEVAEFIIYADDTSIFLRVKDMMILYTLLTILWLCLKSG